MLTWAFVVVWEALKPVKLCSNAWNVVRFTAKNVIVEPAAHFARHPAPYANWPSCVRKNSFCQPA